MRQISDTLFAEEFLFEVSIATPLLPSPYEALPFLVIEDFFDVATCQAIIDQTCSDSEAIEATLRSAQTPLNQNIRHTKIHTLSPQHQKQYDQSFDAHRYDIEKFFSLSLTQATQAQLLSYTKGSFYKAHADDSSLLLHKDGQIAGFKQVAPQRKITSLLFLSEHVSKAPSSYQYCGGALTFNFLKDAEHQEVLLRPKMGTMIVFASNPIFTHEVKMVREGYRVTVAQWHDALLTYK